MTWPDSVGTGLLNMTRTPSENVHVVLSDDSVAGIARIGRQAASCIAL